MFKILSANTISLLEKEAEGYIISKLGSLTIANGHYFLSFIGEPKVIPEETYVNPEVTKEEIPAIEKPKPKTRRKKPNTNL
tara:strand:+ start:1167 stop:1409 length:243 start_codon:yes stop_codon:yes gene_type:complete